MPKPEGSKHPRDTPTALPLHRELTYAVRWVPQEPAAEQERQVRLQQLCQRLPLLLPDGTACPDKRPGPWLVSWFRNKLCLLGQLPETDRAVPASIRAVIRPATDTTIHVAFHGGTRFRALPAVTQEQVRHTLHEALIQVRPVTRPGWTARTTLHLAQLRHRLNPLKPAAGEQLARYLGDLLRMGNVTLVQTGFPETTATWRKAFTATWQKIRPDPAYSGQLVLADAGPLCDLLQPQ